MQNERVHCHGRAKNSLLPTCRAAFLAKLHEGDVEPAGSTPCQMSGLPVRIRDARCHENQKNRSALLLHCSELTELFLAVVIPDAFIVRTETWFLGRNHKPRSHHQ